MTETESTANQVAGKTVLLVSVGQDSTKESVYAHLKSLGVRLVVLENPLNEFAQKMEYNGTSIYTIKLDLACRPTLIDECISAIDASGFEFDGVLTFWDDAVGLAVRLSTHYCLPGNTINAIDTAHDKWLTRVALKNSAFPSPNFCTINSEDELLTNAKHFKFPVILKPLYGAASIGVIKACSSDEIVDKYRIVKKILDEELNTGGLMGLTFDQSESERTEQNVRTFCMEEFLEGPEYDCDVIMSDGKVVYARAVDNLPLQPPNFCEIMELTPVSRGPEAAKRVENYATKVLEALGFTCGVFHVEVIDDTRLGPVLVECNPRMGGGPMRGIHQDVYGVDLAEEALRIAVGVKPHLSGLKDHGTRKCVTINLHAICSGTLTADGIQALDFLKEDESAVSWIVPSKKGDHLIGWHDGYPSKAGRVHLSYDGLTSEQAIERANICLNRFNHNLTKITNLSKPSDSPPLDFFTARHQHFK